MERSWWLESGVVELLWLLHLFKATILVCGRGKEKEGEGEEVAEVNEDDGSGGGAN